MVELKEAQFFQKIHKLKQMKFYLKSDVKNSPNVNNFWATFVRKTFKNSQIWSRWISWRRLHSKAHTFNLGSIVVDDSNIINNNNNSESTHHIHNHKMPSLHLKHYPDNSNFCDISTNDQRQSD